VCFEQFEACGVVAVVTVEVCVQRAGVGSWLDDAHGRRHEHRDYVRPMGVVDDHENPVSTDARTAVLWRDFCLRFQRQRSGADSALRNVLTADPHFGIARATAAMMGGSLGHPDFDAHHEIEAAQNGAAEHAWERSYIEAANPRPGPRILDRIGRLADGWFIVTSPDEFDALWPTITAAAHTAGRPDTAVGTEAAVAIVGDSVTDWLDQVHAWRERELTHLCLRTLGANLNPEQHLTTMQQAAAELA
jgi:hypothetical protein